ncbi:hypothetical protein SteCoe_9716 [Stentor coeruleus]|uniref:Uncharacterized protein n=1 Tax=Stentor coeruleus TaxID=5963 RepID=A0A1R2CHC3_9CILI|nr:hypothetical protein SteCoe_9716 [Stentor coeruleus]
MGCGNSRNENSKKCLGENRRVKTQGTVRTILSIKISRTVKHKKGLYIVSEVAASQEFSKINSSHDSSKLCVSKQNSKNLTA